MCGLLMRHLLAAGPYGVREIGSKSKRRARWPFEGYWFFRARLVDRFPPTLSDVLLALYQLEPPWPVSIRPGRQPRNCWRSSCVVTNGPVRC